MALGVQFLVLCQAKFPSFSLPDSVDSVARRGELRRMATAIALHRKNYAGCLLGLRGLRFQYWIPLRAGSWLPRDIRWYFHFLRPHHVQRCCHHRHSVHAVLPHDEAFLQRILIYFTIFLCSFSLSLAILIPVLFRVSSSLLLASWALWLGAASMGTRNNAIE